MPMSTAQGLALIRIGLGVTLMMSAFAKTMGGWFFNDGPLLSFIEKYRGVTTAPYDQFLDSVVVPNSMLFAQLVPLGEWVAGISLALGLLTRVGAIVAAWQTLNYGLAKGFMTPEATDDRIFVLACVSMGLAAAGLVWGMDGALWDKLGNSPLFRALAGVPPRAVRLAGVRPMPRRLQRVA